MKAVKDFIFPGSKITTVNDCSHKIKRCLLLGRKAMTNVESILKSRDTTLPSKVRERDHQKKKKNLNTKELILLNCGVRESLGLQRDQTSQS